MEDALRPTTLTVDEDFDQEDTLVREYQDRQDRLTKIALSDAFDELNKIFEEQIDMLERGRVIENPGEADDAKLGQTYKACLLAATYLRNTQQAVKTAGEVHRNAGKRE
jgi:hypothetical protein